MKKGKDQTRLDAVFKDMVDGIGAQYSKRRGTVSRNRGAALDKALLSACLTHDVAEAVARGVAVSERLRQDSRTEDVQDVASIIEALIAVGKFAIEAQLAGLRMASSAEVAALKAEIATFVQLRVSWNAQVEAEIKRRDKIRETKKNQKTETPESRFAEAFAEADKLRKKYPKESVRRT